MNRDILLLTAEEIRKHCDKAEFRLTLMQNHEDRISIRDGEMEQMKHATSSSLAMELFVDGREGFFYTNHLHTDAVKSLIPQALQATILLQPDEDRTLADPTRYYTGSGFDLKNCDSSLNDIDPDEKLRLVMETDEEVAGADKRIISRQSIYTDRQHQASYLTSNGFEGEESSTHCVLTSLTTVDGADGQHPMDGWGETRIFFNQLPRTGIAKTALQRTLRKMGQRPTQSGRYRMILESPCAQSFLNPILASLTGQALHQGMSFLQDRLHRQVLSAQMTLVDDPLIPGTRGACHFDYDGVATRKRTIFDQGRLETYFIDTPYGKKLNMPPTTQGTHHLIMQPGKQTLKEIIQQTVNGILVTDFNGGNCNPVTGDFSYGIEGFLIHQGCIVQPLSGMNVSGNMLDVWNHLTEVSNDADPWDVDLIPSLVFEDVNFGGKS